MPVEAASSRDIYDYVSVAAEQISRYGYQSVLTPQEIYRRGIEFVDAYAQSEFQQNFVDLSAEQQDQILTDMEADKATGFDGPSGRAFFTQTAQRHDRGHVQRSRCTAATATWSAGS